MPGSHILGYLVPGPDGSTVAGHRRYNWVWYRRYTPDELDSVLTDINGVRRPFSLAPGRVRPDVAAVMKSDAARLLPPAFAAVVAAEPRPFLHAIFDYAPPQMVSGRVALMGDAAFVARPTPPWAWRRRRAMPSRAVVRSPTPRILTPPSPPMPPNVLRWERRSSPTASASAVRSANPIV
ncbi:hypothetical protein V5F29_17560 [Xanthobacter aminoxidans]|jgi:hypothetical protein|uniref:FAD binding domain-containing protein n=1 Tax=Xanthobacter aminoxidans TaxID=186280 RepID=UPI003728B0E1